MRDPPMGCSRYPNYMVEMVYWPGLRARDYFTYLAMTSTVGYSCLWEKAVVTRAKKSNLLYERMNKSLKPFAIFSLLLALGLWLPHMLELLFFIYKVSFYVPSFIFYDKYHIMLSNNTKPLTSSTSWGIEAVMTTLVGFMLVFLTIMAICVIYRARTLQKYGDKVRQITLLHYQ